MIGGFLLWWTGCSDWTVFVGPLAEILKKELNETLGAGHDSDELCHTHAVDEWLHALQMCLPNDNPDHPGRGAASISSSTTACTCMPMMLHTDIVYGTIVHSTTVINSPRFAQPRTARGLQPSSLSGRND